MILYRLVNFIYENLYKVKKTVLNKKDKKTSYKKDKKTSYIINSEYEKIKFKTHYATKYQKMKD